MKKLILLTLLVSILFLAACEPEVVVEYVEIEIPAECDATPGEDLVQTDHERIVPVMHINGHLTETEEEIYVMFEYKFLKYTRYQVSYISCTCRDSSENFRQVMYLELNNEDGSIKDISFDIVEIDGDTSYIAGAWGDSSPIPDTGKTKADFEKELIEEYLIGKTLDELSHISNMSDMTDWPYVDSYAGSSVTVNNMVRAVKAIQSYQLNKEE